MSTLIDFFQTIIQSGLPCKDMCRIEKDVRKSRAREVGIPVFLISLIEVHAPQAGRHSKQLKGLHGIF
jgi:hypothetical protein